MMKTITYLEMINCQSKKMTKTIFFVACILCTHSMLAQMSITQPGVGNDLDPADYVGSQNKAINIDIDGDGAMDFMVFDSDQNDLSVDAFGVDDIGGTNGVNSIPFPLNPAAPLELVTLGAANDVIGSGDTFNNVKDQLLYVFAAGVGGDAGAFLPGTNNGYIGVEFVISGVVHYGFITVSFTDHATWNIDCLLYTSDAADE